MAQALLVLLVSMPTGVNRKPSIGRHQPHGPLGGWNRKGWEACVKTPAVFAIVRDAVCLGAGIFGILYQQITGRTNIELLMVYLVLVGTPGAIGLAHLIRGKPTTNGTVESPSSSQSELL